MLKINVGANDCAQMDKDINVGAGFHARPNQRGITLLALIVTVIVLIILASIAISYVLGEGGLINRAKDAKGAAEYERVKK